MFTLGICTWKYSNNIDFGYTLVPTSNNQDIQQYFLKIATQFKEFDVNINGILAKQLHGYLKVRLHRIRKQQLRLIHRYLNEIEPLIKLLTENSNKSNYSTVKKRVTITLNEITNELIENLEELTMKTQLIDDLKRDHFEYYNVLDYFDHQISNEQIIEQLLIENNPHSRILCSNDTLNHNNPLKFNKLRRELSGENIRLIYADFSDCSFQLSDMKVLPINENIHRSLSLTKSFDDDVINILLLGETGVGKSTFINAFVNYLTFDTFNQAEINQPIALIPVSFLLTIGDNFDEHLIQFGDSDHLNNEDFTHSGQSVTQNCKSHRFDLRRDIGKKLCIIDTPGFGDTRGLEQNDRNMQHIFQYLNKLTHLNAVCFLLQPNLSKLNYSYHSYLMKLFDRFGINLCQNITFAFTNSRSTSYTPGNTATLLRTMLQSFSIENLSFKKENTFCFDSESFRYLVALQNGIQFEEIDKNEYEMSWKTSVSESNRMLNYVRTQLQPYPLRQQEQTDKYAQIQIVQMIRPILETMRNLLRNLILIKTVSSNTFIKLNPRSLSRPTAFCTLCKRDPFFLGHFWLLPDDLHQIHNQCLTCQCNIDQHMTIDYILSYEISKDQSLFNPNEMNKFLDQLCLTSVDFAYFLIEIIHSTNEDPFLLGLMHIMEEEKLICTEVTQHNELNQQLYQDLKTLIDKYEKQMQLKIQLNSKHTDLQTIYQQIQTIQQIPIIYEQIAVIKAKSNI